MTEKMSTLDVLASMRKVAQELEDGRHDFSKGLMSSYDLDRLLDGAAYLIRWIASGLEREFELAMLKGRKQLPSVPKSLVIVESPVKASEDHLRWSDEGETS